MEEREKKNKNDMEKKKVSEIKWEELKGMEERLKKKVVGWVVGFKKKGKEEDEVIEVDGIEKVKNEIIEEWKKEKKE